MSAMKREIVFLLWVSVLFALGQAASAASDHAADEQAIRRLNEDALKAYNSGEVSTLDRIEDADFVLTGDFGEVSRAKQIEDASHHKQNASDVRLIVANQHIRFYGDTAVLTEIERYGDGQDFPRYQTTSVWVRRGQDWKLVHMHYSTLTK
jgi:ketosteroid isomerase-like protein